MQHTKFIAKTQISTETIEDLLICAYEGGSNYWYMIEGVDLPVGRSYGEFCEDGVHGYHKVPLAEGCAVLISDKEEPESEIFRLDQDAIARGLQIMAEKYPRHFADATDDEGCRMDADTGDVFLQCCLFGELVYG